MDLSQGFEVLRLAFEELLEFLVFVFEFPVLEFELFLTGIEMLLRFFSSFLCSSSNSSSSGFVSSSRRFFGCQQLIFLLLD